MYFLIFRTYAVGLRLYVGWARWVLTAFLTMTVLAPYQLTLTHRLSWEHVLELEATFTTKTIKKP